MLQAGIAPVTIKGSLTSWVTNTTESVNLSTKPGQPQLDKAVEQMQRTAEAAKP